MRGEIVALLIAIGLGVLVTLSSGVGYGLGATLLSFGIMLAFINWWRMITP
jgi:hypothetical protein